MLNLDQILEFGIALRIPELKSPNFTEFSSSFWQAGGLEAAHLGHSHLASTHTEVLLDQSSEKATHACHNVLSSSNVVEVGQFFIFHQPNFANYYNALSYGG